MSKYGAQKIKIDGIVFDSKKEAYRYGELKLLERAGKITNLKLQEKFELIPAYYETVYTGERYKIGEKKGQPKEKVVCIEQGVSYIADFCYIENGRLVVEDTKGVKTKEYIIKRKLMFHRYGIKIKEI